MMGERLLPSAGCHHVALLSPEFLRQIGLSPQIKVLDLKERVRCRGCGAKGRTVVSGQVGGPERAEPPLTARGTRCGPLV
jgi:hypothetical protein